MKFYLILLPVIFVFSLFQGAFLRLNLILLLVLLLAVTRPAKQVVWLAFSAGIFLDLAKGTPLGFSSALFLIFCLLVLFYRRRFDAIHPVFLSSFVFLAVVVYSQLVRQPADWSQALILAFLAFLLRPLVRHVEGGVKLKI